MNEYVVFIHQQTIHYNIYNVYIGRQYAGFLRFAYNSEWAFNMQYDIALSTSELLTIVNKLNELNGKDLEKPQEPIKVTPAIRQLDIED